jgi:hypothetical protein
MGIRCFVLLLSLVWLVSCGSGTDATQTAEACAENDLVAQCPPNTQPDLSADAMSSCDTAGSLDLSNAESGQSGTGSITQACVGTGSCRVVCRFQSPCEYGVQSVSEQNGIVCADPPAA